MQLSHVSTRSGWRQFVSTVLFAVLGMMLPLRFAQAVDSLQAVDTGGAVGQFTSLVLDGSGFPVVSHYDATNHDLKVVHCNDANCTGNDESIVTVDSAGDVGWYTSLVLDGSGYPVVSYYDTTNTALKVVHCNDANCAGGDESIVTVDSAGTVGQHTSLALDSSGYPVVSYNDTTNGDLKVVHCNDANCAGGDESIVAVDSAGTVGWFTSLVLDSSGYPVVSYYDITNGDLKVVHCNDANCAGGNESVEAVDITGIVGQYTSLVLDSSGYPGVSYYDITNLDLKVVRCNDANCTGNDESIVTVDSGGIVGQYTSLVLDSSGYPVVSYYDITNGDLKLAHCDDANCAPPPPQVCGNSVVEGAEECDEGSATNGTATSCCAADCTLEPNTKTCRSAGACDVAESCDGSSPTCPGDTFAAPNAPCGSSDATACDAPDSCDGLGTCVDRIDPNGFQCNPAGADATCDPADTCNGSSKTCTANVAAVNTPCGSSDATACDAPDSCDGSGACVDRIDPTGTICNPAGVNATCDPADTCDGSTKTCTANVAAVDTPCGGSDAGCDALDTCNGSGTCVDNRDTGPECVDPCDNAIPTQGCQVNGVRNQPCVGTTGNDIIIGTSGDDVIVGGNGNDTLKGEGGADLVCGGAGNDTLYGGPGNDTVSGGPGDDTMLGDAGNDMLLGGDGKDKIAGGLGNDTLNGEAGNDVLKGDAGTDVLDGGTGTDICTTGETVTNCP